MEISSENVKKVLFEEADCELESSMWDENAGKGIYESYQTFREVYKIMKAFGIANEWTGTSEVYKNYLQKHSK